MRLQLIFLICLTLISCNKDKDEDCSTVICLNLDFMINLTDKNTGDNIILTEQFTENDVSIRDVDNEPVEVMILQNKTIIIYPDNKNNGNYILTFGDKSIEYSYEITEGADGCCDFGNFTNVNVVGYEFNYNENLLEILVD